jgi:hypothetical protein
MHAHTKLSLLYVKYTLYKPLFDIIPRASMQTHRFLLLYNLPFRTMAAATL